MKFYLKLLTAVTALLAIALLSTSCKNKEKSASSKDSISVEAQEKSHSWYFFSSNGYEQINLPQNSPAMAEKPWPESIRVCGSGTASDENNQKMPLSFALVNRLGLMVFGESGPALHSDINLFDGNTASNLTMQDNSPFFSLHKSSFFNETNKTDGNSDSSKEEVRPFLVRYDVDSGIIFPIITYQNLQLETNDQITGFSWNGKQLNCSIKTTENEKNKFSYFTLTPSIPLLSITPKTAPSTIFVGESNAESFRNSKRFEELSSAPVRLKKLLFSLPDNLPILLECSFSGNSSQTTYSQNLNNEKPALSAKAIIADTWILTVFEDGTCYFAGACYGRPVLANGKTVAFRLPKLPEGFVYTYFALSGTQLYVAWEESNFYQTARSGFINVNLDTVLYSKLRTSN